MIGQVLSKEKESNYLLVQKYDFEMVKEIRDKVREKYEGIIREQEEAKLQKEAE